MPSTVLFMASKAKVSSPLSATTSASCSLMAATKSSTGTSVPRSWTVNPAIPSMRATMSLPMSWMSP